MQRAQVVIGANFGDEGKGLATDFLTSRCNGDSLVVRFNGGAQAGHTVVTNDGRRHVFGHFGSGAFNGSTTFLSRFFVSNPILFLRELAVLHSLGLHPAVIVDPTSLVTTPYDMMLNQHVEVQRGRDRHGSCGVGFGETIERSEAAEYRIVATDLRAPGRLLDRLDAIRRIYVPARLSALGIDSVPDYLLDEAVLEKFVEDCALFAEIIDFASSNILRNFDDIVFEGAQGLMLDMDNGYWPHVTRSRTGLANVAELAVEGGLDQLDVHYVTRAYLTRHGAGPLPYELDAPPSLGVQDRTNVANAWQGALRFGIHDVDVLRDFVVSDLRNGAGLNVRHRALVTCLDQMGETIEVMQTGKRRRIETVAFPNELKLILGAASVASSWGESRRTIRAQSGIG
jgi:adenylosuccinate synthase